ncbi:MAG TPA: Sapep family Mn(2+)-dependent dipeptidase [Thermoanaerobaculia bacterium]|nr:Sapep family Mn(2+)-dependent dipeptidase [Thermoanaerobaculia bacterium]
MFIASLILAAAVDPVLAHYDKVESKRLVPMLQEVIRFPTYDKNEEAHAAQKQWLMQTAKDLGFVARDAGKVTEIELPGPKNAPVLGLVVHGDVQPVDADAWSFNPFEGRAEKGFVMGRGAADDKGPLVQALLAMKALKESKVARTHTIRLLVGSEEESSATEMPEYLKTHTAPDYSLVLDSEFPVVVGEKAWDGLALVTPLAERGENNKPFMVTMLDAGLAPSIVPDHAEIRLKWRGDKMNWTAIEEALSKVVLPEGRHLSLGYTETEMRVLAYGKSAHAGVNITGGKNALVILANALEGKLPKGGADDLLAFARMAGQDLYGTGLGITDTDPLWGRYAVNVATIKPLPEDPSKVVLYINLRRTPPRTGAQSKAFLASVVEAFNKRTGASLAIDDKLSYFDDEPLGFNPNAKIVRRLMRVYSQATGVKDPKPAISGGGTYAKRLPNAIAFGMWFPGQPYPGHDVDEKIAEEDLQRGARVLMRALVDIATGPRIHEPFTP